ncbi:MAG: hypothetical protein NPIRA03_37110 [Nitrospirales bacterium]|nr:MAG: hypothetical protein NPIRA03_37110 [Nitrospirales bacterium]
MATELADSPVSEKFHELEIWPPTQEINSLSQEASILATQFADHSIYQSRLVEHILSLEGDPEFSHAMPTGGSKVRHLHLRDIPEASFISNRALELFAKCTQTHDPKIELSWASIYRSGSYLTPHSHPNATGTVTYCLDLGNPDYADNLYAGKLVFTDPRISYCCNVEEECVSRSLAANLNNGMMILFPGKVVHFVHPYNGTRPRISLTWNIN